MNTKQVIVIRKDLNMRKGKIAAQASHASMSFLTKGASWLNGRVNVNSDQIFDSRYEIHNWLNNSFRKIVCYVNSEEELLKLYEKCKDNKLIVHLITDNGATEFNNVPTRTCLAIGPHWDERFVGVTDHLLLL